MVGLASREDDDDLEAGIGRFPPVAERGATFLSPVLRPFNAFRAAAPVFFFIGVPLPLRSSFANQTIRCPFQHYCF